MALSCTAALAQSIEDAKKMLYYERYKSAIKILEPMVNASGANTDAAYCLAEAYLQMSKPNIEKARSIINKALQSNTGNGFLTAAQGQIAFGNSTKKNIPTRYIIIPILLNAMKHWIPVCNLVLLYLITKAW